jgi:glyoxylase-like metal-dependent hydrolase (beta-lactamase superfamily II)
MVLVEKIGARMKLADGLYLVASGASGTSLTHDSDCNSYAIDCGSGIALIDCGAGFEPNRIIEELVADGLSPASLRHLLLTHYHLDHCGGAGWFRDQFRLNIAASALTAQAVSTGDEDAISLPAARQAGVYAPETRLTPCPVDRVLTGGETLIIGEVEIEVLATPGHSRDMLSYLVRRQGGTHLFCGDTLFFGGKILLSNTHDCDVPALCRSVRAIAERDFDGFFPGHQLWSLRAGHRHAEAAMSYINRLLLPPAL